MSEADILAQWRAEIAAAQYAGRGAEDAVAWWELLPLAGGIPPEQIALMLRPSWAETES